MAEKGLEWHTSSSGQRQKTERRSVMKGEVWREVEDGRISKAAEFGEQGAWMEAFTTQHFTFEAIKEGLIQDCISFRSVHDTLPSPANLHQWRLIEDPAYKLCRKRAPLLLFYPGRSVALTKDGTSGDTAKSWKGEKESKRKRNSSKKTGGINFIKEDMTPENKKCLLSVFDAGSDWELWADLDRKLAFPNKTNVLIN